MYSSSVMQGPSPPDEGTMSFIIMFARSSSKRAAGQLPAVVKKDKEGEIRGVGGQRGQL